MELTRIINLLLIAIVIICTWQGYKKGIIMGIIQVLVIILSLYGAQLLSDTFSYEVIPVLRPFVSGYMETQVEHTTYDVFGYEPVDDDGNYNVPYSIADMLDSAPENADEIAVKSFQKLGLYDEIAQTLGDRTLQLADTSNVSLVSSAVTVLCQSITWYLGFLLFFFILFSLLTVIVNIPNLSFRLPYVGIVNDIGGAFIGVAVGFMFCSLLVWIVQFAGLVLPEETLRATGVAAYFMDQNFLGNYITF